MTCKGDVEFGEPHCISRMAAGASLHCPMATNPQLLATTGDTEEEEAFLESVTGQQSSTKSAGHAPLMRVRRSGEEAWDASFVLQPSLNMHEGQPPTAGSAMTFMQSISAISIPLAHCCRS